MGSELVGGVGCESEVLGGLRHARAGYHVARMLSNMISNKGFILVCFFGFYDPSGIVIT